MMNFVCYHLVYSEGLGSMKEKKHSCKKSCKITWNEIFSSNTLSRLTKSPIFSHFITFSFTTKNCLQINRFYRPVFDNAFTVNADLTPIEDLGS